MPSVSLGSTSYNVKLKTSSKIKVINQATSYGVKISSTSLKN